MRFSKRVRFNKNDANIKLAVAKEMAKYGSVLVLDASKPCGLNIPPLQPRTLPNGVKNSPYLQRVSADYVVKRSDVAGATVRANYVQSELNFYSLSPAPMTAQSYIQGTFSIEGWTEKVDSATGGYVPNLFHTGVPNSGRLMFDLPLGTSLEDARDALEGTVICYQLLAPIDVLNNPQSTSPLLPRALPNGIQNDPYRQRVSDDVVIKAANLTALNTATSIVDVAVFNLAPFAKMIGLGVQDNFSTKVETDRTIPRNGFSPADSIGALGMHYFSNSTDFNIIVPKGTTLDQARAMYAGMVIRFQLAIEVNTSNLAKYNPWQDISSKVEKNLFDLAKQYEHMNVSMTYDFIPNGIVLKPTVLGWRAITYKYNLIPNNIYTIQAVIKSASSTNRKIYILNSADFVIASLSDTGSASFTAPTDGIVKFQVVGCNSSVLETVTYTNIQLELGSVATPYVPHAKENAMFQNMGSVAGDGWSLQPIISNVGMDIVYENLLSNGDFSNGTNGWTAYLSPISTENNTVKTLATGACGGPRLNELNGIASAFLVDKRIYASAYVRADKGVQVLHSVQDGVKAYSAFKDMVKPEEKLSHIFTMSPGSTIFNLGILDNRASGWTEIISRDFLAINLTDNPYIQALEYRLGRELTVIECDRLFAFTPKTNTVKVSTMNYFKFDGIDTTCSLSADDYTDITGNDDFSINFSVITDVVPSNGYIICKMGLTTDEVQYSVRADGSDGTLYISLNSSTIEIAPIGTMAANSAYCVSICRVDGELTCVINDELIYNGAYSTHIIPQPNKRLGARVNNTSDTHTRFFNGYLGHLSVSKNPNMIKLNKASYKLEAPLYKKLSDIERMKAAGIITALSGNMVDGINPSKKLEKRTLLNGVENSNYIQKVSDDVVIIDADCPTIVARATYMQAQIQVNRFIPNLNRLPMKPLETGLQNILSIPGWTETVNKIDGEFVANRYSLRSDQIICFDFPLGTTLPQVKQELVGLKIRYQLATPVILNNTPILKDMAHSDGRNLISYQALTKNSALTWATAADYPEAKSVSTDFIKVSEGSVYLSNKVCQIMFFNESKEYLGSYKSSSEDLSVNAGEAATSFTVQMGLGIEYVRLGMRTGDNANIDLTLESAQIYLECRTPYANLFDVKDYAEKESAYYKMGASGNLLCHALDSRTGIEASWKKVFKLLPSTSYSLVALNSAGLRVYAVGSGTPILELFKKSGIFTTTVGTDYYIKFACPIDLPFDLGKVSLRKIVPAGIFERHTRNDMIIVNASFTDGDSWMEQVLLDDSGDTIIYNNAIANGDFSDGTNGWPQINSLLSAADNVETMLSTAIYGRSGQAVTQLQGERWYHRVLVKADSSSVKLQTYDAITGLAATHTGSGEYEVLSLIYASTNPVPYTSDYFQYVQDIRASGWTPIYIKERMAINLSTNPDIQALEKRLGRNLTLSECDRLFAFTPNKNIISTKTSLYFKPEGVNTIGKLLNNPLADIVGLDEFEIALGIITDNVLKTGWIICKNTESQSDMQFGICLTVDGGILGVLDGNNYQLAWPGAIKKNMSYDIRVRREAGFVTCKINGVLHAKEESTQFLVSQPAYTVGARRSAAGTYVLYSSVFLGLITVAKNPDFKRLDRVTDDLMRDYTETAPSVKNSASMAVMANAASGSSWPQLPLKLLPNGVSNSNHLMRVSNDVILDEKVEWTMGIDAMTTQYSFFGVNVMPDSVALSPGLNTSILKSRTETYLHAMVNDYALDHYYHASNGKLYLWIAKAKIDSQIGATTLDKFKAWIKSNPMTLIYQLTTPIDILNNPINMVPLLPRTLPNGVQNTHVIQNVTQDIPITPAMIDGLYVNTDTVRIGINIFTNKALGKTNTVFSTLETNSNVYMDANTEEGACGSHLGTAVFMRLNKSKLISPDVAGFRDWLANNPTTVRYQLASPVDMSKLRKLGTMKDMSNEVGKNLFDINDNYIAGGAVLSNGVLTCGATGNTTSSMFLQIRDNLDLSYGGIQGYSTGLKTNTFKTPSDTSKLKLVVGLNGNVQDSKHVHDLSWMAPDTIYTISGNITSYALNALVVEDIQIELGSVATAYEPYRKFNVLMENAAFTSLDGWVDKPVLSSEGESVTYKNLVTNGDFKNGLVGWVSNINSALSVRSGKLINTVGAAISTGSNYQTVDTPTKASERVYVSCRAEVDSAVCTGIQIQIYGANFIPKIGDIIEINPIQDKEYLISGIITASETIAETRVYIRHNYVDAAGALGKKLTQSEVLSINLSTNPYIQLIERKLGRELSVSECDQLFAFAPSSKTVRVNVAPFFKFDATDTHGIISANSKIDITGSDEFRMTALIMTANSIGNHSVFGKYGDNGLNTTQYEVLIKATGELVIVFGGLTLLMSTPMMISVNSKYLIEFERRAGRCYLRVNGALLYNEVNTQQIVSRPNHRIGARCLSLNGTSHNLRFNGFFAGYTLDRNPEDWGALDRKIARLYAPYLEEMTLKQKLDKAGVAIALLPQLADGVSKGTNAMIINPITDIASNLGKNLIDSFPGAGTLNGITFTTDGVTTVLNGTATTSLYLKLSGKPEIVVSIPGSWLGETVAKKELGAVTSSMICSGYTSVASMPVLAHRAKSNISILSSNPTNPNAASVSLTEDVVFSYIFINTGTELKNFTIKAQLEKGTVVTAYEPYKKNDLLLNNFAGNETSGYTPQAILSSLGDEVPYKNRSINGDFSNGITGWSFGGSSATVTSKILTVTGGGDTNLITAVPNTAIAFTVNERYYGRGRIRVRGAGCTNIRLRFIGGYKDIDIANPVVDQWYNISELITAGTTTSATCCAVTATYPDTVTQNGKQIEIDGNIGIMVNCISSNPHVWALETKLGRSLTAAECDRIFPFVASAGKSLVAVKNFLKFNGSTNYGTLVDKPDLINAPDGDAVTYTNMMTNGDFSNGTAGFGMANTAGISSVGGICEFTATASGGKLLQGVALADTKRYYASVDCKADSNLVSFNIAGMGSISHDGSGAFKKLSNIITWASSAGTWEVRIADFRASGWTKVYVENFMLINLTDNPMIQALEAALNRQLTLSELDRLFAFTATTATTRIKKDNMNGDITGLDEFEITRCFVTDTTIKSTYLVAKNILTDIDMQYGVAIASDGRFFIILNGGYIFVATIGTIVANKSYIAKIRRREGRLISILNGVEIYNQVNTMVLPSKPNYRYGALSNVADGSSHQVYSNVFDAGMLITKNPKDWVALDQATEEAFRGFL